jgi:hypothetical protein
LKARIWKLKEIRRRFGNGRRPLCLGDEDAKHKLLNFMKTKMWRAKFLCNKWLSINEDLALKKINFATVM